MEAKTKKTIDYKELDGVSEMVDGCDDAMVTYILAEDMRLHKLVIFYDSELFDFDHITPGISEIIKGNYRVSLFKSFAYTLRGGVFKCSKGLRFWAVWLKDIVGFTPDAESTYDCRKSFKKS